MGQDEDRKKTPWWKEIGKTRLLLFGAACLGLLLLAFPGGNSSEKKESGSQGTDSGLSQLAGGQTTSEQTSESDYAGLLEKKLCELLSSVEGVGQAEVMITLKTSEEAVFQVDESVSENRLSESDSGGGNRETEENRTEKSTVVIGSSGGEALMVRQIMPQIEGVVVICEGGDVPAVKSEICEAVGALFDVPAHKIKVLKRVSGKS